MPGNKTEQDSSSVIHDQALPQNKILSVTSKITALSAAAALSGIPADIIAFPFCRIKTVMMTQRADPSAQQLSSTGKALRHIYKTQGFSGYFRGLSPVLTSAVPGTTLFFLGMELTQNTLGHNTLGTAISGFTGQIAGSI